METSIKYSLRIVKIVGFAIILGMACGCGDSSGEFEYVALGASDATGVGASPLSNGYVYLIQNGLKADDRDVGLLNLGIPGATAREIKNIEVPVAIDEKPELVTIFTGANDLISGDAVEEFSDDLGTILRELSTHTEALIAVATIPDLTQLPRFQANPDRDVTLQRVNAFNSAIREQARRYGALLVEVALLQFNDADVSDDGFHPSDRGHELLASAFLERIQVTLHQAELKNHHRKLSGS